MNFRFVRHVANEIYDSKIEMDLMARLQTGLMTLRWILAGACLCASQTGWSQTTKSPPAESSDPYFKLNQPIAPNAPPPLPKTSSPTFSFAPPSQAKRYAASAPHSAASESSATDQRLKPMPLPGGDANPKLEQPLPNDLVRNADSIVPVLKSIDPPIVGNPSVDPDLAADGEMSGDLQGILNRKVNIAQPSTQAPAELKTDESLVQNDEAIPQLDEVFEPGRVLVIVGGRPILVGDMLQEINELIEKHAQQAPENQKQSQRQLLVPRMLPKFVDRQLIYIDSVRGLPEGAKIEQINESLGQSFDDEALPKFLEKSGAPSSSHFDAQLRSMGSSLRQFRQSWIEDQFVKYSISQKMRDEGEDEVSYQDMKDYYEKHASDFQFPARARWEQLVVRFDREPDRQAAHRLIAEMGNEVVYGAPLDAVAKKSSHDIKANEGGQQGWVTQGSLTLTALDDAIFQLPLNELSDVIETPAGLHIIRVLERTPAGAKPFRDAQIDIKEKLVEARHEKRFDDYLSKLRREIPIEIIDQSVKLPEQFIIR